MKQSPRGVLKIVYFQKLWKISRKTSMTEYSQLHWEEILQFYYKKASSKGISWRSYSVPHTGNLCQNLFWRITIMLHVSAVFVAKVLTDLLAKDVKRFPVLSFPVFSCFKIIALGRGGITGICKYILGDVHFMLNYQWTLWNYIHYKNVLLSLTGSQCCSCFKKSAFSDLLWTTVSTFTRNYCTYFLH